MTQSVYTRDQLRKAIADIIAGKSIEEAAAANTVNRATLTGYVYNRPLPKYCTGLVAEFDKARKVVQNRPRAVVRLSDAAGGTQERYLNP